MQATSTFDLIERIRQGDSRAFEPLFQKYARRLAIFIRYRMPPELALHSDVDDILQETFLEAYRDLGMFAYRGPQSFFAWLAGIARHVMADELRSHERQRRKAPALLRFRSESNPQGPEPADTATPSRLLSQKEALEELFRKLNTLPKPHREAILLAKVEGLTTAEIAERIGKSREAVSLLLHRALKRLREMEQHEPGPPARPNARPGRGGRDEGSR